MECRCSFSSLILTFPFLVKVQGGVIVYIRIDGIRTSQILILLPRYNGALHRPFQFLHADINRNIKVLLLCLCHHSNTRQKTNL